jgi:GTP-binding protein EngB required for normal cell division
MGQTKSKELDYKKGTDNLSVHAAVNDINILRRLAEYEGPIAVSAYIDKSLHKWKKEQVTFAITGRSATGKSTFINTFRNLKPGDDGFAKAGSGGTTKRPTLYIHPKNDQIAFCDLPGYSTPKFKKEDYISEMKMSNYDFFFILFNNILCEEEIWMVGELRKLGKPFFLVRSKIDIDIDNAKYDNRDQEMVIPEIKEEIEIALNANPELKDTNGIFLISSRNPKLGEMSDLIAYVEDNIDGFKAQVLRLSLHCITKKIVERKYKMLRKKIVTATAHAAGVAYILVPVVGVGGNIKFLADEVCHYMSVFGVDPERINSLKDFDHSLLKCRFLSQPNLDMIPFVTAKLDTNMILVKNTPILNLFLPLVGSVISSATVASVIYKFLHDMLQDIKDDVVLLHEHIMKTNANQRMSKRNTE